jgi:hypothetical protein
LILDPPSPQSSAQYSKPLLLAFEFVQKEPATPARLRVLVGKAVP